MSSTILRDPDVARPWPPSPLRSSPSGEASPDQNAGREPGETRNAEKGEAESLLDRARREAEELVQSAHEEADRQRASALQQARDEARSECEQERTRLRELTAQVGLAYQRFCRNQVPALADLATLAAGRLLGEQVTCQPEQVMAIVRAALEQVLGSTHVTLRLHPDDIELVQNEFFADQPGHSPTVQIVPDSAVDRGGCWIDSEQGKVDATVAGRFARLQAAMGDE